MRNFIRFLSFRSFIVGALVVGAALVFFLASDDLTTLDVLLLAAYVAGCVLLTWGLRTPHKSQSNFDALASFDRVLLDGRPTLVEFYSDYCAACMANRPILDRLEMQVEH